MSKLNGAKKKKNAFRDEFRKKITTYIMAAFGLVAALAWNDAIKELIASFYPLDKETLVAKFMYAGIITLLLVVITFYLMKLFKKEEEK